MGKTVFQKAYTRDYSIIIEEIWARSFERSIFCYNNRYKDIIVDYICDGVIEVWENREAIKLFRDELYQKNKTDKDFFHHKMQEHEELLAQLKNIWANKSTSSLEELKYFIDLVVRGMDYFLLFYYSAMDTRNSSAILDLANKFRDEDKLFEESDNFIRNSIERIYPSAKGLANTLIIEDLDQVPETKILKQRYQNFVANFDNYLGIISLQDFLKENTDYEFIFDKVLDDNEVKGQVAFKGKARGKVQIVKRKNQVNNFEEGRILVSPMTTPDFVPAMKKAVAFVTDEGGIVCHAAIISRELKIPCVIGTKIASKVFQDGDMVEVDAEKGIVRKI